MLNPVDSITMWYDRLKSSDEQAAQVIWNRYFPRIVALARAKLTGLRRRAASDEEDVAISAFDSFCRRVQHGGLPDLADRDDLWRLLSVVTARKAARLVRDENRLKRGGGNIAGESVFENINGSEADGIAGVAGQDPSPAMEAELTEEFLRLLDDLGDDELRTIALWKMEGYTNVEIGHRLGKAIATIERRLTLIRKIWERAEGVSSNS